MKKLIATLFLLSFLLPCFSQAQEMYMTYRYREIYEYSKEEIQVDKLLVNGKYHDYIYGLALGHPFFGENEFVKSTVVLRNTAYTNQLIKYNIYDQTLVLKPGMDSMEREIILPNEFVQSFTYKGLLFRSFSFNHDDPVYVQEVAATDDLACLYLWQKTREESSHMVNFLSYKFSPASVKRYLLFDNRINRFRNNRKFIKAFPERMQKDLKNHMKSNRLKLKRISDQKMSLLIEYCQTQLNPETE